MLHLVEAFLKAGILDGLDHWTPETGSPQGAVISPLLSNIYLDPLDQLMAHHGFRMVRYADDFVVLCRSGAEAAASAVKGEIRQDWTAMAGLTLHPQKTRIVQKQGRKGFDFLGYHFEKGKPLAPEKEYAEGQGNDPGQTSPDERPQLAGHH